MAKNSQIKKIALGLLYFIPVFSMQKPLPSLADLESELHDLDTEATFQKMLLAVQLCGFRDSRNKIEELDKKLIMLKTGKMPDFVPDNSLYQIHYSQDESTLPLDFQRTDAQKHALHVLKNYLTKFKTPKPTEQLYKKNLERVAQYNPHPRLLAQLEHWKATRETFIDQYLNNISQISTFCSSSQNAAEDISKMLQLCKKINGMYKDLCEDDKTLSQVIRACKRLLKEQEADLLSKPRKIA